ncbi:ATP-binding protein [Streptomyces sp. NBC_00140]|uniref:ATP-binding protein n=1 Tax=Streptomyces sp. NBC_00140 TaxID=2975664 RepID=UPI0022583550|nr:ATP-binding protein [Streptomyces sp. NBC_00140]MCX5336935.1 ATP-binding protein [Streptomyces sp. NBC_00140]MCX5338418.1 ATP-binding protein [Streptomyces sp. NBC_00140]
MLPIPPLDPKRYQLEELLAARGVDLGWLNAESSPYGTSNVARWSIVEADKIIPVHYAAAIADNPDVLQWTAELKANALKRQQASGAPIASIDHGPSLLLLGPTGTGKTHQAYAAIRELAITGVVARWTVTTAPDMYAALRPRHGIDSEAEFRSYRSAAVLLVDDLGASKVTEFTEEVNFRLVDYRYKHHLPTLFTSNALPRELNDKLGARVTSRLREMCQNVPVLGQDRRRRSAA